MHNQSIDRVSRVLVIGSPGAGKSTLATRLAEVTGLPLHHLDDAYWGPMWTIPEPDQWERYQRELVGTTRWIIDGNHLSTLHLRVPRAEVVVLVDATVPRCLVRVIRRALRIRRGWHAGLPAKVRPISATPGEPEKVRSTKDFPALLRMVALFRLRSWDAVLERVRANPDLLLVVAVSSGRVRSRIRAHGGRLRRLGVAAMVVPVRRVPELFGAALE